MKAFYTLFLLILITKLSSQCALPPFSFPYFYSGNPVSAPFLPPMPPADYFSQHSDIIALPQGGMVSSATMHYIATNDQYIMVRVFKKTEYNQSVDSILSLLFTPTINKSLAKPSVMGTEAFVTDLR